MKLYVVRHGESVNNLKKIYTGWQQAALTDKGRADAKWAKEVLSTVKIDKAFSSDLIRAMETGSIALPDMTAELTDLLREVDVGNLAGQPLTTVTDEMRERIATEGYTFLDGESREDFRARVRKFMKVLESLPYENIAAFSHRGWIIAIIEEVLGVHGISGRIKCDNCAVAVFEFNGKTWRLCGLMNAG